MRAKELFGTTVLDKNVNEIGRIEDIDVEIEKGGITSIIVSLNKGLFSNDVIEIDFESILTIGDYVLLDKVIFSFFDSSKSHILLIKLNSSSVKFNLSIYFNHLFSHGLFWLFSFVTLRL